MSEQLFSDALWLNIDNNKGYGTLPIPQPRDAEISDLLRAWLALDAPARMATGQGLLQEQRFTLLAFSERMASKAVRDANPEWISLGLLALGIDGWRGDWRDNAALIALHYDASQRLGIEPDMTFERAALLLSDKVANALRAFLRRSADDKSLEAMGYEAGVDGDGFIYKRTW